MKLYLIILLFLCSQFATAQQVDRMVFESTLGKQKARAFSSLEQSFEEFLKSNYENKATLLDRIKSYLTDIQNQNITWAFSDSLRNSTLKELELSGLRKDILIYRNEFYQERYSNCKNRRWRSK